MRVRLVGLAAVVAGAVLVGMPHFEVVVEAQRKDFDRRAVEAMAVGFCRQLGGCTGPLVVKVVEWGELPRGMTATAERTGWTDATPGCTLTFTEESARQPLTVAHEVCHCVNDYGVMSPGGYFMRTARERAVREQWAHQCGGQVLSGAVRRAAATTSGKINPFGN